VRVVGHSLRSSVLVVGRFRRSWVFVIICVIVGQSLVLVVWLCDVIEGIIFSFFVFLSLYFFFGLFLVFVFLCFFPSSIFRAPGFLSLFLLLASSSSSLSMTCMGCAPSLEATGALLASTRSATGRSGPHSKQNWVVLVIVTFGKGECVYSSESFRGNWKLSPVTPGETLSSVQGEEPVTAL
jgi:hypothetical protein